MNIKIVDNFLKTNDLDFFSKYLDKYEKVKQDGLNINKIENIELINSLNSSYHLKAINILNA